MKYRAIEITIIIIIIIIIKMKTLLNVTSSPPERVCIKRGRRSKSVFRSSDCEELNCKTQASVHEPQSSYCYYFIYLFLKRKESRSGSNRSLSASQPRALQLGHTDLNLMRSITASADDSLLSDWLPS